MIAPTNLTLTEITGGIKLDWTCPSGTHETEIYISVDGADYTLLDTVDYSVATYSDINDYFGHTVKYRLRAKGAITSSSYSGVVNHNLQFVFTSQGDGSGCGKFGIQASEDTVMTLDGTGKFYTDAAGTEGESSTCELTADTFKFIYIKVPSGISTLSVPNVITHWGRYNGGYLVDRGWSTPDVPDTYDYPSVSIDVSTMTHLTYITIFGNNEVYGDLSELTDMVAIELAQTGTRHTKATSGGTCTGDLTGMTNLEYLDPWDMTHFTGDISGLTSLVTIWVGGLSSFTCNVTNLISLKTLIITATTSIALSGSVAGLTSLAFLQIDIANTLSGSLSGAINLAYVYVKSGSSLSLPNATNMTKLSYFTIIGITFTSENVNQVLADLWANKDEAKTYASRNIILQGTPTGQGVTDKAALQAYRSPNNDPAYSLWTIITS